MLAFSDSWISISKIRHTFDKTHVDISSAVSKAPKSPPNEDPNPTASIKPSLLDHFVIKDYVNQSPHTASDVNHPKHCLAGRFEYLYSAMTRAIERHDSEQGSLASMRDTYPQTLFDRDIETVVGEAADVREFLDACLESVPPMYWHSAASTALVRLLHCRAMA